MDMQEYYLNNTYQILVREMNDGRLFEWFGYLTLSSQENGEIFIDLSFDDQPVEFANQE